MAHSTDIRAQILANAMATYLDSEFPQVLHYDFGSDAADNCRGVRSHGVVKRQYETGIARTMVACTLS